LALCVALDRAEPRVLGHQLGAGADRPGSLVAAWGADRFAALGGDRPDHGGDRPQRAVERAGGGEAVTPLAVVLVLISQFAQVGGQVLLKRGMSEVGKTPRRTGPVLWGLGGGIALLTAWFGLWMGLMQKLDLSLLYPFTGLSPVLMVLAAGVFLRERADWRTWLGVALIAA